MAPLLGRGGVGGGGRIGQEVKESKSRAAESKIRDNPRVTVRERESASQLLNFSTFDSKLSEQSQNVYENKG